MKFLSTKSLITVATAFIYLLLGTAVMAGTLTATQVAQYAYNAGFRGDALVNAIAIAGAESSFHTDATNTAGNTPPSTDRGLWQLNSYWHSEVNDACAFDPACSAQAVYKITKSGFDWTQWSTWQSTAYKNRLPEAQAAAAAVNGNVGGATMPSGWYWPSGSSDFGGYLGWLGYNSATYPYHLAQDMKCDPTGHAVYSIGDGEVILSRTDVSGYGRNYGPGGALVARYQSADGTWFTALYGHINSPHGNGHVSAGDVIGYTNDFEPPHVHFAIHPGFDPEPNNPWRGYTSDKNNTYGFTDPIPFLNAHARGGVTRPPPTTVVSESDTVTTEGQPGFFRHGTSGYWHDATDSGDGGHMLWTYTNGNNLDNLGDWRPNLPDTRNYEVFVFIPALHATTHKAHYEIYHADGRTDKVIDQYAYTNVWVSLGTYRFNAGTSGILRLDDGYNEPYDGNTKVGFDTAKWESRDAPDTTPPTVTITSGQTNGGTYNSPQRVTWHIDDGNGSGIERWGQDWDRDPGANPFTTSDGNLDLPVGTHTLHVHVRDKAGNEKDWTFGPYTYTPAPQVGQGSDGHIDQRYVDCYNRVGPSVVGNVSNYIHSALGSFGNGGAQDFSGGTGGQGIIMAKDGAAQAFSTRGNIWKAYSSLGYASSPLGFPTSDEQDANPSPQGTTGRVSHFESGVITSTPSGTHEVYGDMFDKYVVAGASGGGLGFPTGDVVVNPGSVGRYGTSGYMQLFEGGGVFSSHFGTFEIHGTIWSQYVLKIAIGIFGFPTSDEQSATQSPQGTNGSVVHFENGAVCNTAKYGVHGVYGAIFQKYAAASGSGGIYGFPTSDWYTWGGGTRQDFEGGYLTSGVSAPTHLLWNNMDGRASLWNYDTASGTFTQNTYGPYSGWIAKSIADGPDGRTRVLWTSTSGQDSLWSLDNTTGIYTHHEFGPFAGWTAGSLSVGSDNMTHVLWTNTSGQMSLWNYNVLAGTYGYFNYGPFAGWTAKSGADGSDGKTRVLWATAGGQVSIWGLDSTTGVYSNHEFGPYPGWSAVAVSAP